MSADILNKKMTPYFGTDEEMTKLAVEMTLIENPAADAEQLKKAVEKEDIDG